MADNWYVILGLGFDPPVEDEAEIAERIDEKARFWSAHFDDPQMGSQFRAWYQNIPQIQRDMIGPANIRRQLASNVGFMFCDPLDKPLKTIGRKGYVTAQEVERVSGKLGIPVDDVKKRVQELGIAYNADTTEEKSGAQGSPECDADANGCGPEDTDQADDLCGQAQKAMEALKFEDAAAYLADAEKYWPNSRRISDLRARLEMDKSRAGTEIDRLRSAMGDKRYFEAQRRYADIRKLFPGYSDPAAQEEISRAISGAQALCGQARSEKNAGKARALCEQACQLCRDLPDIGELMKKYSPASAAGSADPADAGAASGSETVTIRDIRAVNGKISIYIDAPQGAAGFEVLYRFDRFPAEPSDPEAIRRHISIKQYQYDNAIVLDILEEKKYFFTVFAEYRQDGESRCSTGSERLFDNSPKVNITYSISVTRRPFGERFVTLEFETAAEKFALPAIDVMCAVGNAPMFRASAKLFCSISAQEVDGVLQIRIPLPKDTPRDTYIKPFFRDEAAQAGNQLRLKPQSNYKIT